MAILNAVIMPCLVTETSWGWWSASLIFSDSATVQGPEECVTWWQSCGECQHTVSHPSLSNDEQITHHTAIIKTDCLFVHISLFGYLLITGLTWELISFRSSRNPRIRGLQDVLTSYSIKKGWNACLSKEYKREAWKRDWRWFYLCLSLRQDSWVWQNRSLLVLDVRGWQIA